MNIFDNRAGALKNKYIINLSDYEITTKKDLNYDLKTL